MPVQKPVNKRLSNLLNKNKTTKKPTNEHAYKGVPKRLKETNNYRADINEIRRQMEVVKNSSKLTATQKELAQKILTSRVKNIQEKVIEKQKKENQDPDQIKRFKESIRKAFREK